MPYAILQQKSSSLKTAIIEMLSGAEVAVNTATFKNDPAKIASKDDVITYLIHLGYLGYNEDSETAFIPNEEIRQELITAVKSSNWNELIGFQEESRKLLMATLAMDVESRTPTPPCLPTDTRRFNRIRARTRSGRIPKSPAAASLSFIMGYVKT